MKGVLKRSKGLKEWECDVIHDEKREFARVDLKRKQR
jgi:hypothetical protein